MAPSSTSPGWGTPPWIIPPVSARAGWPAGDTIDLVIVGAGLTGLAAACLALREEPRLRVAIVDKDAVGSGASGRSGGIILEGTAGGDAPGFTGVLPSFVHFLTREKIQCDLDMSGCWEVGRSDPPSASPVEWSDGGALRVQRAVPGGTIDPGALLGGLARAAMALGGAIHTGTAVAGLTLEKGMIVLKGERGSCRARSVIITGDAPALDLFTGEIQVYHTLALSTGPVPVSVRDEMGWRTGTPFYTQDLPYLWGRLSPGGGAIFGSGLVLEGTASGIGDAEPRALFSSLESRLKGLHPALRNMSVVRRWAGPIGLTADFRPIIRRHPECPDVIALGGLCGHGVAQSVAAARLMVDAILHDAPLPVGAATP